MKTVLITGASRGIGRAAAHKFHSNGYNIIINYNNSEKAALELHSMLSNSMVLKADVSNEQEVKRMIDTVIEKFGFIDVLVNNAGIAQQKIFTDISTDEWNCMMETNLNSIYYTCKYAVPYMIRQKQGKIINVSSNKAQFRLQSNLSQPPSKFPIKVNTEKDNRSDNWKPQP